MKKTAMQELLDTLKEEKQNLPVDMLQWNHCLQSIITVIEKHYLNMEKNQIVDTVNTFALSSSEDVMKVLKKYNLPNTGEQYYIDNFKSK